eukprot:TRINITY_DN2715_c0_g1_i1.p2 TRINITY_DN2715_c0_g1~~TRINITY_DN2715_c0_g1_i1.p2  ORF type:complete len:230 (+),score=46.42 TRINITY_DN2715_c0_g1_i1:48-737(+)
MAGVYGGIRRVARRWCTRRAPELDAPLAQPFAIPTFEWTPQLEEAWVARHGVMTSKVREVTKDQVLERFASRTISDKLLENLVMLDTRTRREVMHTVRLDVDIDQVYVLPHDEVDDALNLSLHEFYTKYVFPRPRHDDTLVLYGKDKHDMRPVCAARLLQERHGFKDVWVYRGGAVDWRGMEYPAWVQLREGKIAQVKAEAERERRRLEDRRKEELERYRRERARKGYK